jgi:hypothetical protein
MPWAAGQDPPSYVGAYRHVVGLMRSVPGASFTFDWCCAWGPTEIVAESVYPGDDVVDIIGMDIYGRYYAPADGDEAHDWNTSLTSVNGLNWLVSFAQAHGKSLSLPEWGTGEWFVNDGGNGRGDDPVFIESVAHFLTANRALYSDYWDYSDSVYDSAVSDGEHPHAGAALKAAFGATEAASSLLVPGQVPPLSAGGPATAGSVSISFAAPLSGGPAAAYVIQDRVTGQSAWTTSATVTWVGWQTLAGLAPGTSYDVEVYATNASGSGVASAVFSVRTTGQAGASAPTPVPMLLPGPIPAIGAGGPPTASSVSISFAAPYAGGPVAAYVIQWRVRGTADWANNETVTWIGWQTLAGLVAGTSYDVEVYATNGTHSDADAGRTETRPDPLSRDRRRVDCHLGLDQLFRPVHGRTFGRLRDPIPGDRHEPVADLRHGDVDRLANGTGAQSGHRLRPPGLCDQLRRQRPELAGLPGRDDGLLTRGRCAVLRPRRPVAPRGTGLVRECEWGARTAPCARNASPATENTAADRNWVDLRRGHAGGAPVYRNLRYNGLRRGRPEQAAAEGIGRSRAPILPARTGRSLVPGCVGVPRWSCKKVYLLVLN